MKKKNITDAAVPFILNDDSFPRCEPIILTLSSLNDTVCIAVLIDETFTILSNLIVKNLILEKKKQEKEKTKF